MQPFQRPLNAPYILKTQLSCPSQQAPQSPNSDFKPILIGSVLDQQRKIAERSDSAQWGQSILLSSCIVFVGFCILLRDK